MPQRAPHPMVPCPTCPAAAGNPCVKLGLYARGVAPKIHAQRLTAERTHATELEEHGVTDLANYARRRRAS